MVFDINEDDDDGRYYWRNPVSGVGREVPHSPSIWRAGCNCVSCLNKGRLGEDLYSESNEDYF